MQDPVRDPVRAQPRYFVRPGLLARVFNRLLGALLSVGVGPADAWLMEVVGRRTGTVRRMPVFLMNYEGRRMLVAPRGRTHWTRNLERAGQLRLRRGGKTLSLDAHLLPVAFRPPILRDYLRRHASSVRQFFPVPPDAPVEQFIALAERYPVFSLR